MFEMYLAAMVRSYWSVTANLISLSFFSGANGVWLYSLSQRKWKNASLYHLHEHVRVPYIYICI